MKSTKYPLTAGRKLPWTMDHGRLKVGELLNKTRRRHQKRQQQRGVAVHKQRTAQSIDFKVLVSETPGWRVIFEEQNGGGGKNDGERNGTRGRWQREEMNEMCWKSYGCQSALQAAVAEHGGETCRFISKKCVSLWKCFCKIMLCLHYYSPVLSDGTNIIATAEALPI